MPEDKAVSSATAGAPAPFSDCEAVALALGSLVDSLLLHLRERRLLEDEDLDEIYETAIRAHQARTGDPLGDRIAHVLSRMHSDGTATRQVR